MQISKISNNINFGYRQSITHSQLNEERKRVVESNAELIDHLDSLNLMNRSVLNNVKGSIALDKKNDAYQTLRAVLDIISSKAEFGTKIADNGYFAEVPDKYVDGDTHLAYFEGDKKFETPVFKKREVFRMLLRNIAQNGTPEFARRLLPYVDKSMLDATSLKTRFNMMTKGKKLYTAVFDGENKPLKVVPITAEQFLQKEFIVPISETIQALEAKWDSQQVK